MCEQLSVVVFHLGRQTYPGCRRDSYTEILGGGKSGSAKAPIGTATTSGTVESS